MGCAQDREKKACFSVINNQVSYLMPELCRSVEMAQKCLYDQYSPVVVTPVKEINTIGNIHIYGKMENQQRGGSLKIRGAYNKLYKVLDRARFMNQQERIRVVTSSMGNHGLACVEALKRLKMIKKFEHLFTVSPASPECTHLLEASYMVPDINDNVTPTDPGELFDISAFVSAEKRTYEELADLIIFMPNSCKQVKFEGLERLQGVQVVQTGDDYIDAERQARQYAQENNLNFISPYNDVDIIGGVSTIGFELEQWMKQRKVHIDYLFVTVAAGAVATGIGIYLKYMKQMDIRIIGVQHEEQCSMFQSIQQQQVFTSKVHIQSISDSTNKGFECSSLCFPLCQALVDDWILVSEDEIKSGLVSLIDKQGLVIEGAAAMAYAGCLKYLDQVNAKNNILVNGSQIGMEINCMVILGGANIDVVTLQELLQNKPQLD